MENEKELLQDEAAPAVEAEQTDVQEETPAPEAGKKGLFGKKKKKEKVKKTVGQEILSWVFTILAALAIAFVVRTFVFEFVKVDGESMDDTLADGEIMYVSKLSYGSRWLAMPWANAETQENSAKWTYFGDPQRFDVVICRYPGRGGTNFVKRVVGLPGDTVEIRDGYLYVNGEKYDEPYINDSYRFNNLIGEIDLDKSPSGTFSLLEDESGKLTLYSDGNNRYSYKDGKMLINGEAVEFKKGTDKLFVLGGSNPVVSLNNGDTITVSSGKGILLFRGRNRYSLIAHPGDIVAYTDGAITVNGSAVDTTDGILLTGALQNTSVFTVPKKGDVVTYLDGFGFALNGNLNPICARRFVASSDDGTLTVTVKETQEIEIKLDGKTVSRDYFNWYLDGDKQDGNPLEGKSFTLQSDFYFAMGDHRNNSNDSRAVGALERSYIMGKVKQVLWPLNQWKAIPNGLDVKGN